MTEFVHTPEISEKVRKLAPTHTVQEIAAIVGLAPNSVSSFCRVAGIKLKTGHAKRRFNAKISIDAAVALRVAADKRQINADDLVGKLLEIIARDQMFNAILDDEQ